jgi:hypothetical protein
MDDLRSIYILCLFLCLLIGYAWGTIISSKVKNETKTDSEEKPKKASQGNESGPVKFLTPERNRVRKLTESEAIVREIMGDISNR